MAHSPLHRSAGGFPLRRAGAGSERAAGAWREGFRCAGRNVSAQGRERPLLVRSAGRRALRGRCRTAGARAHRPVRRLPGRAADRTHRLRVARHLARLPARHQERSRDAREGLIPLRRALRVAPRKCPMKRALLVLLLSLSCKHSAREVVIYTSVDQPFSEPIFREFEKRSGIKVLAVYDTEETKSTGVLNRIIAEAQQPQADVFWSGDPVRPFLLVKRGLVQPYASPAAA